MSSLYLFYGQDRFYTNSAPCYSKVCSIHFMHQYIHGLYKDRHSYGRSTMSTQLLGVFNYPILKFEEVKSATGVAFCH